MSEYTHVTHDFAPVYDRDSQILILGTLPSVKSREQRFFYGHPQNRFWKVLANIMQAPLPETISEKKAFLLKSRIAVWDVIASCDIIGSSDSSIRNVVVTDLSQILKTAAIQKIYANGKTAFSLYQKYQYALTGMDITPLPSTSPANAAFSLEKLTEIWGQIKMCLPDTD